MSPELGKRFVSNKGAWFISSFLLVLALAAPLFIKNPFPLHVLLMVYFYTALGTSWNILSGYAGQISLGQSVFVGVGGYVSSILYVKFGVNPWLGMIAGMGTSMAFGWMIGKPCFRLGGRYFAIATMAIVQIAYIVVTRWEFIGGARGVYFPMKNWGFEYFSFRTKPPYYYIAFAMMLVALAAVLYIEKSHIGYYLKTIREDQDVAEALGIDVPKYKMIAMCFSTALAAMGGTFYAQYLLFADADSLFMLSTPIMLLTVMGGTGSLIGPLAGSLLLVPVQEYARVVWSGTGQAIDQLFYGAIIVFFVVLQPQGIVGAIDAVRLKLKKGKRTKVVVRGREDGIS